MRVLLFFCCFLLVGLWLAPSSVDAKSGTATERAEMLDTSLQAVEWYTNESVRKALQAESIGDNANAQLFGNRAIESDLKAEGLRNEAAAAWLAAGNQAGAQTAWHRAADMARERAAMLSKRIPPLLSQWQTDAGINKSNNKSDSAVLAEREHEIIYLQAILLTAKQWALVVEFARVAADHDQADAALVQLKMLLPPLQQGNRVAVLASDSRLSGGVGYLQEWTQLVSHL